MNTLRDILYGVRLLDVVGPTDIEVTGLSLDSRTVADGHVFFAVPGTRVDGHDFIDAAIEAGARAVVCERVPDEPDDGVTWVRTDHTARAMGQMASAVHDHPTRQLKVVGVTGTNGKTTVATGLYRLFRALGHASGLISTVENIIDGRVVPTRHTTPDALTLQALLADMVDAGCEFVFMEVSSHALHQERVAGIEFAGAVFTNLSHDHLDYHGTFAAYRDAKKMLFDGLSSDAFALVNIDDRNGRFMLQNCDGHHHSFAVHGDADVRVRILENDVNGLMLLVDDVEVHTRMVGAFNASNLAAMYGAARLLGADKAEVLRALSDLRPADGRFQVVRAEGESPTGIVDYAHTPDALENVLDTLRTVRSPGQRVVTVIGCGGDRDATKRPVMARVAVRLSDQVVLTSDNPRTELPEAILDDMETGLAADDKRRVLRVTDRREAIRTAVRLAAANDIILVAGKGHETYQEVDGVRHDFDDRAELLTALQETAR